MHEGNEAFAGSHRFVLDYLVEEVLHRQPEPVQTFLLQTAVLDRLTGPLCDVVLGKRKERGEHCSLLLFMLYYMGDQQVRQVVGEQCGLAGHSESSVV